MIMKLYFLLALILIPLANADLFPVDSPSVTIGSSEDTQVGVNIVLPEQVFNSSAADSNITDYWNTGDRGPLRNVADILHNWLNATSLLWSNAGHIMDSVLDMNNNNINMESGDITNASIITVEDRYAFNDTPTTYITNLIH